MAEPRAVGKSDYWRIAGFFFGGNLLAAATARSGFVLLALVGAVLCLAAYVTAYVTICRAIAAAAARKGRNYWPWFWIGFFFPIVSAIIIAIMAPLPATAPAPSETKRCPACAEWIQFAARLCRFCGTSFGYGPA